MSQPSLPLPVPSSETGPSLAAGNTGHSTAPVIDSQLLLHGRKEVVILHRGQAYRLQETRAGKLILIK